MLAISFSMIHHVQTNNRGVIKMEKQTFNGVLAFSAGHATAIVFVGLGFIQYDAIRLALGKFSVGDV